MTTKERIKTELLKLLDRYSADDLTLKLFCAESGISKQTLYNHYYCLMDAIEAAQTFSFLSTIGKLEKRMQPYGFVRCHRSVLVSVHHIRSVTRGKAVLDSGEEVPVSRNRLPVLLSRMHSAGKGCHTEEQSKWTGVSFTQKDSLS